MRDPGGSLNSSLFSLSLSLSPALPLTLTLTLTISPPLPPLFSHLSPFSLFTLIPSPDEDRSIWSKICVFMHLFCVVYLRPIKSSCPNNNRRTFTLYLEINRKRAVMRIYQIHISSSLIGPTSRVARTSHQVQRLAHGYFAP